MLVSNDTLNCPTLGIDVKELRRGFVPNDFAPNGKRRVACLGSTRAPKDTGGKITHEKGRWRRNLNTKIWRDAEYTVWKIMGDF